MYSIKLYTIVLVMLLLPMTAFAAGPHVVELARDYAPCMMAGAALLLRVRFLKIHRRR
jgi:hypothetical protein